MPDASSGPPLSPVAPHRYAAAVRPRVLVPAMTAVQTLISLGILSLPAVAPFTAKSLGISPTWVGVEISLLYCFAIASSLIAPRLVRRYGPGRASQMSLGLLGLGLATAAVPSFATMVLAVGLMGLAYGVPNPAASHMLNRHVPPRNRNLLFSIKQSGVPLGGLLAGLLVVPLAGTVNWHVALMLPAALALMLAAMLQIWRPVWDHDRDPAYPVWRSPLGALRLVLGEQPLRYLFFAGILLAAAQLCLSTFLVVLLVEDYRMAPVAAGTVLAIVQGFGFAGRMLWGVAADRLGGGSRALVLLSWTLAAFAAILGLMPPGSLGMALVPVLVGLGACASGWSGVFLAEADQRAPKGHASEAAAVSLIGTFFGVIAGTSTFGALVPLMGSYSRVFLLVAVGSALAAVLMTRSNRN